MMWLVIGALIWIAIAVPLALLIGRAIRVAENRRKREREIAGENFAGENFAEQNFVATDIPPVTAPPAEGAPPAEHAPRPWTGPSTVPFSSSRLPWGGDRASASRPLPPVVRHPVRPVERDPSSRDSGHA